MSDDLELAANNVRRWRERPEAFVFEQFGVTPDAWQLEALQAWADPAQQRIALACNAGPGKTAVESWCAWNFMSCYGDVGEHPKAAAVSITADNLRDNFWAEMSKWQQRSEYLSRAFTWQAERIFAKHHPQTWFLSARAWPKTASPDEQGKTLAGLHSKYAAAFIDESGGIPTTVLRAAEQMLSTRPVFGKILQGGNTISLEGMLYAACSLLRHLWTVIRVTGDPDDPNRSPRIDLAWAQEQIQIYGRDNPWVMAYILGQFPPSSINALLGVDEVEAAMKRHLRIDQYNWAQKRLGVDVARYGDDRTVIFPRQGIAAFRPIVLRHARNSAVSVDIANRVMGAKMRWGSELEFFDATGGWAAGAVDVMRSNGLSPVDVQFAAPALDPRYANRRAELYFAGAAWVQALGALPPIPELVAEATASTYTFHKGKFLIEDKAMVKRRIGRSPDLWDAFLLTFGMVEMPAAIIAQYREGAHAKRDGDPYEYRDGYEDSGHTLHDEDPFR
jgi:phage terminase large subunit